MTDVTSDRVPAQSHSALQAMGERRAPCAAQSSRLVGALLAAQLMAAGCASSVVPDLLALPDGATTAGSVLASRHEDTESTLLVRRVSVPEYMASRRVRYWQSAGVLAEWPDTVWAERIEVALSREFAAALRSELPGWTVCEASCGDRVPAITVKLDLQRLDYLRSEGRLTAVAQTAVAHAAVGQAAVGRLPAGAPSETAIVMERLELPVSPDTAPAQAAALTRLLRTLAAPAAALAKAQRQSQAP